MTTDTTIVAMQQDITSIQRDVEAMKQIMATKQDITEIQRDIETMKQTMATKQDITAIQQDIAQIREEMMTKKDLDGAVETMKLYFEAAVESFEERIRVIDTDKWKNHDGRIIHLEVVTGIRRL